MEISFLFQDLHDKLRGIAYHGGAAAGIMPAGSEESPGAMGLGVFDGSITRIPNGEGLKIPHMGWNSLDITKQGRLFKGIDGSPYVYFVHSYYLDAADKQIVAAQTKYGVTIDAAIEQNNVFATQFHPEKSGEVGLQILRNFADIVRGE